jgi:hypothetical protein
VKQGSASLERFGLLLERLEAMRGSSSAARQAFQEVYAEKTIAELEEGALSRAVRTSALGVVRVIDLPFEHPAIESMPVAPSARLVQPPSQ